MNNDNTWECPNCGYINPYDSNTCERCGYQRPNAVRRYHQTQPVDSAPRTNNRSSFNLNFHGGACGGCGCGCLIAVLVIILLMIGFAFHEMNGLEQRTQRNTQEVRTTKAVNKKQTGQINALNQDVAALKQEASDLKVNQNQLQNIENYLMMEYYNLKIDFAKWKLNQ